MRRLLAFAGVALVGAILGGILVAYLLPKPIDRPSPFHRPTPTELALERAVPELNIEPMPFDAALDKLSETWGVEVTANWKSLEKAGLGQSSQVKLRARDVTLADALQLLLRKYESVDFPLKHSIERAGIVCSGDSVDERLIVRMYDVADLLPPSEQIEQGALDEGEERYAFVDLLESVVDSGSWGAFHGNGSTVQWIGSRLVIAQTESNHRVIRDVISQLRENAFWTDERPSGKGALRVWDERVMRFIDPRPQSGQQMLHQPIGRFWVDQLPVRAAIDLLAEKSGAPIYLDYDVLEDLDFDPEWPVTIHFPDATLYQALRAVLRTPTSTGPVIGLDHGVIVVTSRYVMSLHDLERADVQTRLFDISELIPPLQGEEHEEARSQFVERLIAYVEEMVEPESWRNSGGTVGSIREFNGRLIVTQTHERLRRVSEVLRDLRDTPGGWGPAAVKDTPPAPK